MAIVKRLVDRGLAKSPTMKSKEIKEDVEQVPEQKGGHGRALDDQDWASLVPKRVQQNGA